METALKNNSTTLSLVLLPRFNMMTLATLLEPLRIANYLCTTPLYRWRYLSFDEKVVRASNDMTIECRLPGKMAANDDDEADLVFVLGSWGCEHQSCPPLYAWLRHQAAGGASVCGVEMGIYALARAGMLERAGATTHWSMLAGFCEQFPRIDMVEQLYTVDGRIMTCAGGTAGIDLVLHLINEQHGHQLVSEISDQMLHHVARPAEAPQRQTHGSVSESVHPLVDKTIGIMESNLMEPLSVPELSSRVGISQRQLERYFRRYLDCSVVRFYQLIRLQYARVLLTSTRLPIREVSVASGFNSMSHFSSAFYRLFDKKPSQYRQAWPDDDQAPNWPGTPFSLARTSRALE